MVMETRYIDSFHIQQTFEACSACIGFFDGIHVGHQQLMNEALSLSKEKGLKSAFISFSPDPWCVFHPNESYQHLTSLADKEAIVQSYGFDYLYILNFTKEFAALSVDEFHGVLHDLCVKELVCGFDFQYAYKNSGNTTTLQQQDLFQVTVVDSVNFSDAKISTSRIEPLIESGDVMFSNELLGYIYSIAGSIEHGFQRGTNLLQIPTANLKVDDDYILPGVGVYAGYMLLDHTYYKAMINVGKNPTFDNTHLTIEAHVLDFDEDIYGKSVRFFFYTKIRDEKKFEGFEKLREQLLKDIKTTDSIIDFENGLFKNTRKIFF